VTSSGFELTSGAITILIVDDHLVVREGLRAIFETEPGFAVVGQAAKAKEALRLFGELHPDVTLLDVHLGSESGLDVLCDIRSQDETAAVLMMSAFDQSDEIHSALKLGARGYVLKDLGAEKLIAAVRSVHAGGRSIPPRVGGKVAEQAPLGKLTAREREILTLLAAGHPNYEIAQKLRTSEKAIQASLDKIFEKLEVSDRTQAAVVAIQRGLVPPD
jgi:DNA-binding NarL/FixJ family response regulator